MRIYDIISKKRDGFELTEEEIAFFISSYVNKDIEHYHAAALLMAIYLNGMTEKETFALTKEMAHSGDTLDLSAIDGVTVDKHSTGGVGDKTTLIVAPVVASTGLKVAKMSGRGLGHTGGTIDKLESIEGFSTDLSPEDFISTVQKTGICVIGQTGDLAPADKLLYSLRDSTATVGCMPLIASSIMSKKLAAGSQCIVLDVKYGSGAFMKTSEEAMELSKMMIAIGKNAKRKVAAVISDMDTPLGENIGNSLEVIEAVNVLRGTAENSDDLKEVCLTLAGNIIALGAGISPEEGYEKAKAQLENGKAYEKFLEFISAQGGNTKQVENTDLLPKARFAKNVLSPADGFIKSMNAEAIGSASVVLGAGRTKKDDEIDFAAGITLKKKTSDKVKQGDIIATLHTNDETSLGSAEELLLEAVQISKSEAEKRNLIYEVIR